MLALGARLLGLVSLVAFVSALGLGMRAGSPSPVLWPLVVLCWRCHQVWWPAPCERSSAHWEAAS
eukprot:2786492-Amphidinium_carterae.1